MSAPGRSWAERLVQALESPRRMLADGWGAGLVAVVVAVTLLPALAAIGVTVVDFGDVGLFQRYGEAISAGQVPYKDIEIEYPPGALPLFVLPGLLAIPPVTYAIAFAAIVGGVGMAGLLLAARLRAMVAPPSRDSLLGALGAGLALGLLGAVALTRYDFVPAALTVAALYALVRDRRGWAAVLLGVAIAVKLYPAVVVPVAAAYVLRRSGKRAAALFASVVAVVVSAAYLPFVTVAPEGVYDSLWLQAQRSLHIESTGGTLYWLAVAAGLVDWPPQPFYYDINAPAADAIGMAATMAGLIVLAMLWWRHARRPADGSRLVHYSFAAVATFVVLGKVLSPQFLIWLVLLVPALTGARATVANALLVLAAFATAMYFPSWFPLLIEELPPHLLLLVAVRNVLLVAMLAVLVWRSEGLAAHAD